ncbi:hypothetical protein [Microcoleus sp. BROC3]|uniref:hypothetical protein n=1 Tax=Microcoleus sp. BROC3 TaxID=3055323 RepID=UPI002FD07F8C
MKTLLKRFALLLGLMTGVSTYLVLPASADSTADLVLSLKCQGGYNVNVWKRYNSGELLYRSTSPQGNLSLGKGTRDDTEVAQVYKFKNGNYKYQVLGGKGDRQGKGTLEVYKNGRSIMSKTCTTNG